MYQPLADKIRPKTLDDVVGQRHLLGENGLLRRVIESGSIPNLIFYGPSGVGKTTVASIIAQQTDRKLYHLNATTAGIADIKAIIDELDTFLAPMRSSISTKSSSRACLNSSKPARSRSSHPQRKTRIFTSTTRF